MTTEDKKFFRDDQEGNAENAGAGSGYGNNAAAQTNDSEDDTDAENISTGDFTGSESSSTLFEGGNVVDQNDNDNESHASAADDDALENLWERSFL